MLPKLLTAGKSFQSCSQSSQICERVVWALNDLTNCAFGNVCSICLSPLSVCVLNLSSTSPFVFLLCQSVFWIVIHLSLAFWAVIFYGYGEIVRSQNGLSLQWWKRMSKYCSICSSRRNDFLLSEKGRGEWSFSRGNFDLIRKYFWSRNSLHFSMEMEMSKNAREIIFLPVNKLKVECSLARRKLKIETKENWKLNQRW